MVLGDQTGAYKFDTLSKAQIREKVESAPLAERQELIERTVYGTFPDLKPIDDIRQLGDIDIITTQVVGLLCGSDVQITNQDPRIQDHMRRITDNQELMKIINTHKQVRSAVLRQLNEGAVTRTHSSSSSGSEGGPGAPRGRRRVLTSESESEPGSALEPGPALEPESEPAPGSASALEPGPALEPESEPAYASASAPAPGSESASASAPAPVMAPGGIM